MIDINTKKFEMILIVIIVVLSSIWMVFVAFSLIENVHAQEQLLRPYNPLPVTETPVMFQSPEWLGVGLIMASEENPDLYLLSAKVNPTSIDGVDYHAHTIYLTPSFWLLHPEAWYKVHQLEGGISGNSNFIIDRNDTFTCTHDGICGNVIHKDRCYYVLVEWTSGERENNARFSSTTEKCLVNGHPVM